METKSKEYFRVYKIMILLLLLLVFIQCSGLGLFGDFYNVIFIYFVALTALTFKINTRDKIHLFFIYSICFLLFISILNSKLTAISFQSFKDYFTFSVALCLPFLFFSKITFQSYRQLNIAILMMFVLVTIVSIIEFIYQINILYPSRILMDGRVSGGNSAGVPWSGYIAVYSLGAIYYLFKQRKIFFFIFLQLVSLDIYFSGQRMAIGLLFCALLVIFIYDFKMRKLICLNIILLGAFFVIAGLNTRADSSVTTSSIIEEQQSKRLALYKDNLDISINNNMLGIGLADFSVYYKKYESKDTETAELLHPHSLYLYVLLKIGFFGLITFIFLIGWLLTLLYNLSKLNNKIEGLLLMNVTFNPLQVSHTFNEVWFSVLFVTSFSLILFLVKMRTTNS